MHDCSRSNARPPCSLLFPQSSTGGWTRAHTPQLTLELFLFPPAPPHVKRSDARRLRYREETVWHNGRPKQLGPRQAWLEFGLSADMWHTTESASRDERQLPVYRSPVNVATPATRQWICAGTTNVDAWMCALLDKRVSSSSHVALIGVNRWKDGPAGSALCGPGTCVTVLN